MAGKDIKTMLREMQGIGFNAFNNSMVEISGNADTILTQLNTSVTTIVSQINSMITNDVSAPVMQKYFKGLLKDMSNIKNELERLAREIRRG